MGTSTKGNKMSTISKNKTDDRVFFDATEHEKQHDYVETLKKKGAASFSLVAAEAFVEGMRDSGYKSTGTAIDEFLDNSVQAQAQRVDIIYTTTKPGNKGDISNIAIIDDGHGMEPDMIRASVLWGGTHRANNRFGFGRYGFGLPSAAVSICKRYSVYSMNGDGAWNRVVIDLPSICSGIHTNKEGIVVAPEPEKAELPEFVQAHLKKSKRTLKSGTVIVLDSPDRLTTGFRKPNGFHKAMLHHIGMTYRFVLRNCKVFVNDEEVQAIDPLFLEPSARFYDVGNGVMAEGRDPLIFEVKSNSGVTGMVRLRFSYMPPGFQTSKEGGKKTNERFPVMKENNAYFLVTRAGRQIDAVRQARFPKDQYNKSLQNNDRNWAVELDFDPTLDEEFGVTVNKQQISISDRMWDILESQSVGVMVKALWEQYAKDAKATAAKKDSDSNQARTSEEVLQESEKFIKKPKTISPEKEEKAKERVVDDAKKEAEKQGKQLPEVIKEYIENTQKQPFKVLFESREGAPFFRPEQYGSQQRLHINTAHPFYGYFYDSPQSSKHVKDALELLLFTLGGCELDSTDEKELFYQTERNQWSERLNIALKLLDKRDPVEDQNAANDAQSELIVD